MFIPVINHNKGAFNSPQFHEAAVARNSLLIVFLSRQHFFRHGFGCRQHSGAETRRRDDRFPNLHGELSFRAPQAGLVSGLLALFAHFAEEFDLRQNLYQGIADEILPLPEVAGAIVNAVNH